MIDQCQLITSRDGSKFYYSQVTPDGRITIFEGTPEQDNTITRELTFDWPTRQLFVTCSELTPTSKLAIGLKSGHIIIMSINTQTQNTLVTPEKSPILSIKIREHRNKIRLFCGTESGNLYLFQGKMNEESFMSEPVLIRSDLGGITAIDIPVMPASSSAIIGTKDGKVLQLIENDEWEVTRDITTENTITNIVCIWMNVNLFVGNNPYVYSGDQCREMLETYKKVISTGRNNIKNKYRCYVYTIDVNGVLKIWSIRKKQSKSLLEYNSKIVVNNGRIISASFTSKSTILVAYGNPNNPTFQNIDFIENRDLVIELAATESTQKDDVKVLVASSDTIQPTISAIEAESQTAIQDDDQPFIEKLKMKDTTNRGQLIASDKLIEAISGDKTEILSELITNTNFTEIKNTVAMIPNTLALPFVNFVISKIETEEFNISYALWMRAVLVDHISTLKTVSGLVEIVANLYKRVENRVKAYDQILRLRGRLDLIQEQVKTRRSVSSTENAGNYYEESSEDDEMSFEEE
eukprot:TRINITY_DN9233_c0_g1_i2.p1 TRINITY_DN9233_c0_g1~~TRINITY_DN9233_c0_g1_i2.p1  ORF type:complete len:522 (-),score=113.07 TRINITY_DN9233_c0_g1_i2:21-1586(-)